MIIRHKIAIFSICVFVANTATSQEFDFPGIGMLYVVGLDSCDREKPIQKVPDRTVQYFLTRTKFYKLIVTSSISELIELEYPSEDFMNLWDALPEKPPGCGFSLAIHSEKLEVAKIGLERFNIKPGKILNENGIYYWNE